MGYRTALNGTKTFCLTAVLGALALLPLSAQDATQNTTQAATRQSAEWEKSFELLYAESLADGPLTPSPLALRIAQAAGGRFWAGLAPSEAVRLAVELAMDAEKSLRFGVSAQETRAVLGQRAAIEKSNKNGRSSLKELAKGRKWDTQQKNRMSGRTDSTAGPVGNGGQNNQTNTLPQDGQNDQGTNQGGQGPEHNGIPHGILLDTDQESW